MRIVLEKAGDNPDQALIATVYAPKGFGNPKDKIAIGDVLHISGQPDNVKWRVLGFRD